MRTWEERRGGANERLPPRASQGPRTHRVVSIQFGTVAQNLIGEPVELLDGPWEPGHCNTEKAKACTDGQDAAKGLAEPEAQAQPQSGKLMVSARRGPHNP